MNAAHLNRAGTKLTRIAATAALLTPMTLMADLDHVFQDGQVIYADDVNANFSSLDDRLSDIEAGVAVDDGGNLGLGTSTPEARLDIRYSGDAADTQTFIHIENPTRQTAGKDQLLFQFEEYNASDFRIWRPAWSGAPRGPIVFGNNTADTPYVQLALDQNNGGVGIATANPATTLDVNGGAQVRQVGVFDSPTLALGPSTPATSGEPAGSLGFFGFGIVHGGFLFTPQTSAQSTIKVSFGTNGNPEFQTATATFHENGNLSITGALSQSSDARLKADVTPVEDALSRITALRGVSFEWADDQREAGRHLGVIAQEVEQQFPELVGVDDEGYRTVDYSGLVAPLIEAVKTQQGTIEAQGDRIQALEAQNAELLRRFTALERRVEAGSPR